MSEILQQLRIDHANFAGLLTRLESELDKIRSVELAEIELMREIMHYLTRYPDTVHHPREDLIFSRLVLRDDTTRPLVDELTVEHRDLAEKGNEFLRVLGSVVDGAMVHRELLEQCGGDYVEALRTHIRKEEGSIFRRIETALMAEDWAAIEAADERRPDPLFGSIVEQGYRDLFDSIARA